MTTSAVAMPTSEVVSASVKIGKLRDQFIVDLRQGYVMSEFVVFVVAFKSTFFNCPTIFEGIAKPAAWYSHINLLISRSF